MVTGLVPVTDYRLLRYFAQPRIAPTYHLTEIMRTVPADHLITGGPTI